jgi:5-methylcytosine-specific restriction protein A
VALKPTTRKTGREKQARREYDQRRGSARARGYDTAWDAYSLQIRRDNPLCVWCLERGIVKPSEHVHHIQTLADHPELKYEPTNTIAICKQCHDAATARGE